MVPQRRTRVSVSGPCTRASLAPTRTSTSKAGHRSDQEFVNADDPLPIPTTDAFDVAALWRRVRGLEIVQCSTPSFARPTAASNRRANNMPAKPSARKNKDAKDDGERMVTRSDSNHAISALAKLRLGTGKPKQASFVDIPTPPASTAELSSASGRPSPPQISAPTSTSRSTARTNDSSRSAQVTDSRFRENVLPQYRIIVEAEPKGKRPCYPYNHFGVTPPHPANADENEIVRWYQQKHKHEDSSIWLSLDEVDAEFVLEQYQTLSELNENEAAFSFCGKVAFLRADTIPKPSSHKRAKVARCTLEWGPLPCEDFRSPPVLDPFENEKLFNFEIKSDLTFWVSLSQFSQELKDAVGSCTFLHQDLQIAGPYFTVEFKRDHKTLDIAVNQLAAACAIALYNRVGLRMRMMRESKHPGGWSAADFRHIAHYGIAFGGRTADIYCATPNIKDTPPLPSSAPAHEVPMWSGCTMTQVANIVLNSVEAVRKLRAWVHEIQNWGLGEHSKYFVEDVKAFIYQDENYAEGASEIDNSLIGGTRYTTS